MARKRTKETEKRAKNEKSVLVIEELPPFSLALMQEGGCGDPT